MKTIFIKFWLLILVAFCLSTFPGRVFAVGWGSIGFDNKNVESFYVDPNNNQKMLVSLQGSADAEKIYVTENGGEAWSQVSTTPDVGYCNQFVKAPSRNNEFWAACATGLYHSVDNAKTFQRVNGNFYQTTIDKIVLTKSGGIFVAYSNQMSYSSDGVFWSKLTLPGNPSLFTLFINPNNSNLYISKTGYYDQAPGLYRSTDNGSTWLMVNNSQSIKNGLTTLLFFNNSDRLCASSGRGVACSDNGGLTWGDFKPLKPGVDYEPYHFYSAIQNPEDENNIIVLTGGYDGPDNIVYSSKDAGASWNSNIAPNYSSNITVSMGDIFVWSPNANWLKGIWKIGGVATLPEYLKKHPVIIVPGILGSWPWPFSFSNLILDPFFKTYDGLQESFMANGYEKDKTLFAFPYNWRNDNAETAKLLKQKIDEVKNITGSGKVDIVAHSMGGLVTRSYAQSNYYENDIDQIIFLGTPHLGSPSSYPIWEAGDLTLMGPLKGYFLWSLLMEEASLDGYIGNNYLYKYIHEKVLSIQQLLPIYNYLKLSGENNYLNYPYSNPRNTFLEELNKNKNILLSRKIRITNIIGDTGDNTVNGFSVLNSEKSPLWEFGEPLNYYSFHISHFISFLKPNSEGVIYSKGDDTVPAISNEEFLTNNIVLNKVSHGDLPNEASAVVLKELRVSNPEIKFVEPIHKALVVMAHSPIDFYVETPDGKRIGTNEDGIVSYSEVEGAFYSGNESNAPEFVIIPDPINGIYKIMTVGTGVGGFELESTYSDEADDKSYSTLYSGQTVMGKAEVINVTLNTKENLIKSIEENKVSSVDQKSISQTTNAKIVLNNNPGLKENNYFREINIINDSYDQGVLGSYNITALNKNHNDTLFCYLVSDKDVITYRNSFKEITLIKKFIESIIKGVVVFVKSYANYF